FTSCLFWNINDNIMTLFLFLKGGIHLTTSEVIVEMRHIVKQFGDFKANDDINLEVRKGEIHALLGENGAGKSTLMNVLTGLLEPTEGEIRINGEPTIIDSPDKADELGI